MDYKIEITKSCTSIRMDEILYDAQGNPVSSGRSSRCAVGVGDYDSKEEYVNSVYNLLISVGASEALATAQATVAGEMWVDESV